MLLDINDYILFENVKLSREIVTNAGKDPDKDPQFLELTKLLRKNPNLMGKFTDFLFNKGATLNQIERVMKWVLTNKELAKKIPQNSL